MAARRALRILMMLVLCAFAGGCSDVRSADGMETVVINGHSFQLEVVADEATRRDGLMHREAIADDGGMFFIYPSSQIQSYWMGYCLVDIDIIFLDPRGRVTATHRMKAESPKEEDESEFDYHQRLKSYWSNYPSQFAIELKAGWLDKLGLHVDDKIELDLERLKGMAE